MKILSIDGGGIRGILPACVLSICEDEFTDGTSAGAYFDYISGTSTGGIIALGLSLGLSARDILQLYLEHGEEIFPPRVRMQSAIGKKLQAAWILFKNLRRYKYDRDVLSEHLAEAFGDQLLGHAERRLVIPSFDEFNEVTLFKTPHHPDYKMDWKLSAVDVALSTAAAPTFFSTYKNGDRQFADGGVWANNPLMVAIVDALACYSVERHKLDVLSLGCAEWEFAFSKGQISGGGLWHWRGIISSAMRLQSQNAIGQAGLLIGRERLLRLDGPPMRENPIEMDDFVRAATELPAIARKIVDENRGELTKLFSRPRAPFQAFYGPRAITFE